MHKARILVIAAWVALWSWTAAKAAPFFDPDSALPLCSEEVIYGTVIAEPALGAFGLRGTSYVFVVSEEVSLSEIDGKQVRIEIAPDCSVRDLHVISGAHEAIT